jgi:hypothetical protein
MIELRDPRWQTLSHAYGSAADIPDLLRQLDGATGPKIGHESEPWFSLWSSLCHQGDVYDASYAALPHIVEIACNAKEAIDFSFFQLPAAIEIARNSGNGPPVPTDLTEAYSEAVSRLTECVALHRHEDWDEPTLLSAASALAAAKGHHRVAEAIMNLDDDLITRLIELDFGDS